MKKILVGLICLFLFSGCLGAGRAEDPYGWNLRVMGFDRLLEAAERDEGLRRPLLAAVIDTGCDVNHELFRGRISPDSRNFFDGAEDDLSDPDGHGTSVAGVLASATPENVRLLIIRVGQYDRYVTPERMNDAILYALEKGADVVNFSISTELNIPQPDGVRDVCAWSNGIRLCREKGVPFVCGAGNKARDAGWEYPAADPDAVAVSSLTLHGTLQDVSDYGKLVEFSAPGAGIRVPKSGTRDGYLFSGGTSLAAPHITAAFAWAKLLYPEDTLSGLTGRLHACAVDPGTHEGLNGPADMPVACALREGEAAAPLCLYARLRSAYHISFSGEGPENLLDGNPNTKWCVPFRDADAAVYAEWQTDGPAAASGIIFMTADDTGNHPGRNPEGMILYGRNAPDGEWREIWRQDPGRKLPGEDRAGCFFAFPERAEAYEYYRLEVPSNGGDNAMQLSVAALVP